MVSCYLADMVTTDQFEAAVLGLLVGDALGVPYEFHAPQRIPPLLEIELRPPTGFRRAHGGTPPGTWSDDGAQALVLLESLKRRGRLDLADLARGLVRWRREGWMAVDGRVFDIGVQTTRALDALEDGAEPSVAGPSGAWDNGNGSLMRVLPLALWHSGGDAELASDAAQQSRVTHGHLRSQLCCAWCCLWARCLADGVDDAWARAGATLRGLHPEGSAARRELDEHIAPPRDPGGTGYVVDTLHSARWALAQGSYERVVRAAISLGNDTDTTACVAGGLAGLRDGLGAIPERWLGGLRWRERVEELVRS